MILVASWTVVAMTTPAEAYTHHQRCFKVPYSGCYDVQGQIYNPWVSVQTRMDDGGNVWGICAKAVTAANNVKTPTNANGEPCATYTYVVQRNYYASPTSQAYGYWGDNGCHCNNGRWLTVSAHT